MMFALGRRVHGIALSFRKKGGVLRIGGMSLTFVGFLGLIVPALGIIFF